jgi:glycerophosphoryl diester phosphodiesterase
MTLVIAHRGASRAHPPGNTVDAFRAARELGADWVELDVRRSTDGVLVVHHDAALPDGRVIASTAAADLPPWVPSLAAALDAAEGMGVNIEIKNSPDDPDFDPARGLSGAVIDVVGSADRSRFLVTSFDPESLEHVRRIDPTMPVGLLAWDLADPRPTIDRASAIGCGAVNPLDAYVDSRLVADCQSVGLGVNVWTVNDPDRMRELVVMGVAGIISDVPDVARAVVDGRA